PQTRTEVGAERENQGNGVLGASLLRSLRRRALLEVGRGGATPPCFPQTSQTTEEFEDRPYCGWLPCGRKTRESIVVGQWLERGSFGLIAAYRFARLGHVRLSTLPSPRCRGACAEPQTRPALDIGPTQSISAVDRFQLGLSLSAPGPQFAK